MINCETDKSHSIDPIYHITVNDEFLYRKVMHYCNWHCFLKWQHKHNFSIKKEKIFAIDIGSINIPNKPPEYKPEISVS